MFLPSALLALVHLALPALSHASPQPALISTDWEMSLIPRHTLFYRQATNLQTFDGALGGTKASAITNSGNKDRPFSVDGDTFDKFDGAGQRSCDNQFKGCQEVANGNGNSGGNQDKQRDGGNDGQGQGQEQGQGTKSKGTKGRRQSGGGLTVGQCDEQRTQCNAAQQSAPTKDFNSAVASTNIGPDPQFPDFDLICES
ncbi:hypothetical protein EJ02DRAFT_379035 [Clathrospora elynae]|uniref:Uncharacterized protein n=1 Tax=Clathrospora elynae TaxID=706981 RepID=A0A6A5SM64_9PLEO|nr:hypothetical protein EJ02DRAFT_379035 [Clathrospora elynae]